MRTYEVCGVDSAEGGHIRDMAGVVASSIRHQLRNGRATVLPPREALPGHSHTAAVVVAAGDIGPEGGSYTLAVDAVYSMYLVSVFSKTVGATV